jgi:hypothetical protein
MFLKILILSVFLVAFTVMALGVKLFFNKKPSFNEHACTMEDEALNNEGGCASCEIKELVNCTEEAN